MSRSNNTETENPCTKWLEWNGGGEKGGHLEFYDKNKVNGDDKDDGGKVALPIPFVFIFLDQLSTVKGWNDASNSSIWAREVRNTATDPIVVKAYKGAVLGSGIYSTIKDSLKAQGAKFTANIYVAIKNEKKELVIGSIALNGVALKAWSDFYQANKKAIREGAVKITGFKDGQKGGIKFRTPVFAIAKIAPETDQKAIDLDKILQEHLVIYLAKNTVAAPTVTEGQQQPPAAAEVAVAETKSSQPVAEVKPEIPAATEDPDDDLPF